jgi:hypothetical protein
MRAPILTLLLLATIAAPAAARDFPRGDDRFKLGMTRPELDRRIAERGLQTLSVGRNNFAIASDDPAVEFERYVIVPRKARDVLAEVTVAYRVPSTRADFDAVCDELTGALGEPAEHLTPGMDPAGIDRESVSWSDGKVLVRLMTRWTEKPDPLSDRMTVIWTDLGLRQAMLAIEHSSKKPKSK